MTSETAERFAFKAEIQQLLDILVHSLYQDEEVFLRELISNASDALSRVKLELLKGQAALDASVELGIWIEGNEAEGTLAVRDSGVGMTREELVENLGTIAQSGARSFVERLRELNGGSASSQEVIGQFGVGFYAVFMVADEVTVTSRSYQPEAEAAFWRSSGQGSFEVGPAEMEGRGARVELKLKESARSYARAARLREIIREHSNFVAYPIYLKDGGEWQKVNEQTALWRERPQGVSEETYREFYQQRALDPEPPLRTIHFTADSPIQFYALLFIPSTRERLPWRNEDYGLTLYARKVLIQENVKDLLPPYLRFIEGVVDSEDLPLNVSRETVQATPLVSRIRRALTGRVTSELTRLAEEDSAGYERFFRAFGVFLKEGVATDASAQGLADLLRFSSSKSGGGLTSLEGYLGRMKALQKELYYLLGDDPGVVAGSSHLDPFRARDLEVLYLTDPVDPFLLMGLSEYRGHPLKSVDEAGLELPEGETPRLETPADEGFISLGAFAKRILGRRVSGVREGKLLTESPARLVSPSGATNFYRAQRLMGREVSLPERILELNPKHELVRMLAERLEADADDPLLPLLVEQLFENELLKEGLHPNPAEMAPRIQKLMAALSREKQT